MSETRICALLTIGSNEKPHAQCANVKHLSGPAGSGAAHAVFIIPFLFQNANEKIRKQRFFSLGFFWRHYNRKALSTMSI